MWLEDIEDTDKVRQSFIQSDENGEPIPVPFPADDFMAGRGECKSDSRVGHH